MSYSIYDKYLTVADCKYYCKQIANRLDLNTFDYFFDKYSELQFPGDSNIRTFDAFHEYEDWRLKFNLTKPATIKKMGLDEYVSKKHELVFNLTIKGFRFLYVCKFSKKHEDKNDDTLYIEEKDTGQMCMLL
jgi:hypothetical protein